MHLDSAKGLEYFKYRDLLTAAYFDACDAATQYFALDRCPSDALEQRLDSLEQHYDQLVFWRCQEMFNQLPEELVPTSSQELDELLTFLRDIDPQQPIAFKPV